MSDDEFSDLVNRLAAMVSGEDETGEWPRVTAEVTLELAKRELRMRAMDLILEKSDRPEGDEWE